MSKNSVIRYALFIFSTKCSSLNLNNCLLIFESAIPFSIKPISLRNFTTRIRTSIEDKSIARQNVDFDILVAAAKQAGETISYDYSNTWLIFIGLTVLALIFALLLKAEDKKMGYGLELPNIEEEAA